MNDKHDAPRSKRQYPPFYERFVPIALGIIAVIIVILLLIILGVALGLFPVVTVLLASAYLKERLSATQWVGVAMAAVAVTLISVG